MLWINQNAFKEDLKTESPKKSKDDFLFEKILKHKNSFKKGLSEFVEETKKKDKLKTTPYIFTIYIGLIILVASFYLVDFTNTMQTVQNIHV